MKPGDRVRLIRHPTWPQYVGQVFTVLAWRNFEHDGRVDVEDRYRILSCNVEDLEVID